MIITGEPDHVTDLIPALCQKCPQWQKCKGTACNVERRYQVDIEICQTLEAETGTRVAGKTGWVHVAGNHELTYLFFGKRGQNGMTEMGILPHFSGVAIHDCWASYWKFPVTHAICCAHLLRELNGVMENHPQQTWEKSFRDLLLKMKKLKEKVIARDKSELSYYHLHNIEMQYDEIIQTALEENPLPEKKPGQKGVSLITTGVLRLTK